MKTKLRFFGKPKKDTQNQPETQKNGQQFGFVVGWVWRILGSGVPDPKLEPPNF